MGETVSAGNFNDAILLILVNYIYFKKLFILVQYLT